MGSKHKAQCRDHSSTPARTVTFLWAPPVCSHMRPTVASFPWAALARSGLPLRTPVADTQWQLCGTRRNPDQGSDCVMTETRVPFGDKGVFSCHTVQLPL